MEGGESFDPMLVFLWIGFVGAWLLFAGPVYQAALELREQGFDRDDGDRLREQMASLPAPARISPWWWLLPPVAYLLHRRAGREWRARAVEVLDQEDLERFVTFQNKAMGWLLVGAGALAIAAKETAELIDEYHWSWWLLIPMLLVPFLVSVGFTMNRMRREIEMTGVSGRARSAARPPR